VRYLIPFTSLLETLMALSVQHGMLFAFSSERGPPLTKPCTIVVDLCLSQVRGFMSLELKDYKMRYFPLTFYLFLFNSQSSLEKSVILLSNHGFTFFPSDIWPCSSPTTRGSGRNSPTQGSRWYFKNMLKPPIKLSEYYCSG
jgi:hypothetical protein